MDDFKSAVTVAYNDIFDDYAATDIVELLNDIPSRSALEIVCHFFGQMHTQERNHKFQIEYVKVWLGRLPVEVQQKIVGFIKKTSGPRKEFNFINNFSALLLIERILENYNESEPVENLTPKQELNLFKAYLWCSQEWIDKQSGAFNGKKVKTTEDFIELIFPVQAPQVELIEFKDFRLQFIKAIYFFRFCEKDELFSEYLSIFLKEHKLENWQDYLKHLISAYLRNLNPPNIPTLLDVDPKYSEFKNWLANFCVDTTNFKGSDDFTGLRNKPVLRYNENKFLFLNLNFFIDKLYQGIQFDFANALRKAKATYKGNVIKNFPDFKQIYGEIYSEHGLFYEVIDYVFATQKKYLKISGETLKKTIEDGEPDYYIRDKSKVYLFEYKDVLINADAKHSYDYEKVKAEIFKKLVENQGGKAKGVTQLVNSIEEIANGEYNKIDDYDFSKAIIYPIIVYTDPTFDMPGINYLLQKEFIRQLKNKGLNSKLTINKLTLIDLDSLIKFQDLFREKKLALNCVLNGFYEYTRPNNVFRQASTFNQYIHNVTLKWDYNSPKMLMEEAIKLVGEDEE